MNDIVAKLENVLKDNENTDINEALATLKEETTKTSWSKKAIKMTLNAIKGIASDVVANQITPIVAQGLSLLM